MQLTPKKKTSFQRLIWGFYRAHKRDNLPWRKNITPYRIWVSEIMLQQTQVDRVIPFFKKWIKKFPTVQKLAGASQVEILSLWRGLGYNSRALRMKKAAEVIVNKYHGKFPEIHSELVDLPGIGPYTAGAICVFAYNQPVAMIETNIRRVYLHNFFRDKNNIHDRDLMHVVERTIGHVNPREWYFALMDYGAYLGKTIPNPNKKSRHYTVQKKFKGSDREIRGEILKLLLHSKKIVIEKLIKELENLSGDCERIEKIITDLDQEGFLEIKNGKIWLKK